MSTSIAELLIAAEPAAARPLTDLVGRIKGAGWSVAVVGSGASSTEIRGVTADSRDAHAGSLFVAIPGAHTDGHDHALEAIRGGAVALLVEHPIAGCTVPQLVVRNARPLFAEAAAWWYGDPSRDLGVIGITGTDGKTTTCFLAAAALAGAGMPAGFIGTVATQIGGRREANPEHITTPESPALQRALRAMVMAGDRAAIIETTSHGLAMDRVAAIEYDVAVFTNLSHEHLELHGTYEAYRAAKRSLFERLAGSAGRSTKPGIAWPRTGIVNADDAAAGDFEAATRAAGARLVTYGRAERADVRLLDVTDDAGRQVARYVVAGRTRRLALPLAGRFNVHNALAVVALGGAIELDPDLVDAGLEGMAGVPGRMERVERGQPFEVVIDYAHSPASLALVLDELGPRAAREGGGLIAVFGSAGERDTGKRPLMGRVAGQRCRLVVVTDEDPRAEDRATIIAAIAAGARAAAQESGSGAEVEEIADRRSGIREAFRRAGPGDVVLLAGKGHESTILGPDGAAPWDERAEAVAALAGLGWTG